MRSSGGGSRRRSSVRYAAAGAAVLALALAGCTGGDSDAAPDKTALPTSGAAGVYPVPPSAAPSEVPALGTASFDTYTFALTAVRRTGPDSVVVEGALSSSAQRAITNAFTEPGYYVKTTDAGKDPTPEFSAVELHVSGDDTSYLPMRDDTGLCGCTTFAWPAGLQAGKPTGVFVYMTAPASATKVDVAVKGFATFHDVTVTQ